MEIQERILKIMQTFGMNAGQFANALGVQPSSVSHILSGRNKPSLDFITKILQTFEGVDYNWLVLGKGNMLNADDKTQITKPKQEVSAPKTASLFDIDTQDKVANKPQPTPQPTQTIQTESFIQPTTEQATQAQPLIQAEKTSQPTIEQVTPTQPVSQVESPTQSQTMSQQSPKSNIIINQADTERNTTQGQGVATNNKHITQVIVLYSDNTFEVLSSGK